MNRMIIFFFVLGIIFSWNTLVFADEGHDSDEEHGVIDAVKSFRAGGEGDRGHPDGTDESQGNEKTDTAEGGHGHSDEGTEGHSHVGDEPANSSPNMSVLGTFGAINLSFLAIGVWNKWIRKKSE